MGHAVIIRNARQRLHSFRHALHGRIDGCYGLRPGGDARERASAMGGPLRGSNGQA